jgi:hypothetical protein
MIFLSKQGRGCLERLLRPALRPCVDGDPMGNPEHNLAEQGGLRRGTGAPARRRRGFASKQDFEGMLSKPLSLHF